MEPAFQKGFGLSITGWFLRFCLICLLNKGLDVCIITDWRNSLMFYLTGSYLDTPPFMTFENSCYNFCTFSYYNTLALYLSDMPASFPMWKSVLMFLISPELFVLRRGW